MNNQFITRHLLSGSGEASPFMVGIDYAMTCAFPPPEGEFPERIAMALQALETAMGDGLPRRSSARCGSGGTPRNAAHVHWDLMPPMAKMIDAAFLPHSIRHGLHHPSEAGLRP